MTKTSTVTTLLAAASLIAVGMAIAAQPVNAADSEKCYGVSAAGSNDCATATSSCAGTSTVDNQSDAFVIVPAGLCGKLAGGSLEPKS